MFHVRTPRYLTCVYSAVYSDCSQCEHYVCDRLTQRLVVYEEVRRRIGAEIPEDDHVRFIQPYENKRRLDALRASSDDSQVD